MQKKHFICALVVTILTNINPALADNHIEDDFEEICTVAADAIVGDYSIENQSDWQTAFDSCISEHTESYDDDEHKVIYEEENSSISDS